jgi:hypothetical protein
MQLRVFWWKSSTKNVAQRADASPASSFPNEGERNIYLRRQRQSRIDV